MQVKLFPIMVITLLVLTFTACGVKKTETISEKPKLILQITIDQMHGDFPSLVQWANLWSGF